MPKKAKLKAGQRQKFDRIRRNKGKEAAAEYRRDTIQSGKGTGATGGGGGRSQNHMNRIRGKKVRQNVKNDLAAGQETVETNIPYLNPNVTTDFGSSTTTVNPDGTVNYTETMDPQQKALLDQSQGLAQQGMDAAGGLLQGYDSFQDPTQSGQGVFGSQRRLYGSPAQGGGVTAGGGMYPPQPMGGPGGAGGIAQPGLPGGQADPYRFSMGDYGSERNKMEEAVYGRLTKNFDRDMSRELDAKKQELYNKGIPYSDNPESRYQKEIRGIQDRYSEGKAEARSRATEMGAGELESAFNIASGAFGTNLKGMGQQYVQGLKTHQQGMSDMATLQGVGTGAIMPNLPGYNAPPPISTGMPSKIRESLRNAGLSQQQIDAIYAQIGSNEKIAGMQTAAQKEIAANKLAADQAAKNEVEGDLG